MVKDPVARINSPSKPAHLSEAGRDQVIIGAYDGVYAFSFRYPTFALDPVLATKGYQFVEEDMLQLPATRAPFNLKRCAVLKDGWDIEPAIRDPLAPDHQKAQDLADAVRYGLENIRDTETDLTQDFREVLFALMMGAWTGNRLAEIGWQYQEDGELASKHGFQSFWDKSNKQIAFDVDPHTMGVKNFTSYTPAEGYDFSIPVEKCCWYRNMPLSNDPHGTGDWRACYKHWYRLDNNLRFWAIALERWGAPCLLMIYPAGNSAELRAAAQTGQRIRNGATAAIPDTMKYEVLQVSQGTFEAMERAAAYDTEQIAINIHSNSLTTGAGQNSLALGKVHQDTGDTVYDALSADIEGVVKQQIISRFVRYNFGQKAVRLCPNLRLRRKQPSDVSKIASAISLMIAAGNLPSRSKIIRDQLGWSPIDADEEKMLEEEKAARVEARQQLADARQSGKIDALAPITDAFGTWALETLTSAILTRNRIEANGPNRVQS